jgi:hypothetical protein
MYDVYVFFRVFKLGDIFGIIYALMVFLILPAFKYVIGF